MIFVKLPSGERFSISELGKHGSEVHLDFSEANNKTSPCRVCQAGRVVMTYTDRARIKKEYLEAFEKMMNTTPGSPDFRKAMDEFEPKLIALLDTWGEIELG